MSNFTYCEHTGVLTRISTDKAVGTLNTSGYLETIINGTRYPLHRLIWVKVYGKFPDNFIDHINGNRSDNRLCNLRQALHSENMLNKVKYKNNSSGYKGVYYSKTKNKYEAQIRINGKKYSFGGFLTAEEASIVYEQKSKELFKEFNRI